MSEMEEIAEKLALYHMLFLGCFMGMIVSFTVSVSFFLRYRIWEILGGKKKGGRKRYFKRQAMPKKGHRQKLQKRKNPKTALLSFRVEREIVLIHTKEEI